MFYDTADIAEETCGITFLVNHLHIEDFETATVIVTFKALHTGSQGGRQRFVSLILHVDVVCLHDIDLAVLHQADIFINRPQLINIRYLERLILCTQAQLSYLIRQDGHQEVQSVIAVFVIGHKLNDHFFFRTHNRADVLLDTIHRTVEDAVAALVGQLHKATLTIGFIHGHIVARLVVAVRRLCSDGS